MFHQKVVLACILFAVVSAQTNTLTSVSITTRRPLFGSSFQKALDNMRSSVKGIIRLVNITAQTSANVVNTGIQGFTGAGRQMVNTITGMKSTALNGGVDAFKKGVDIGTNMMGMVPSMHGFASTGGGMVKAGGDVINMIGQSAISAGNGIVNGKFSLASGLAQAATNLATAGINIGSDTAIQGVDVGFGMADNAVGTIGAVLDSAMDYVNKTSTRVSSLASAAADNISVSVIPSSCH